MRPWHYHYSPEAVPLSGAGEYLGVGLHVRSRFTDGAEEKVQ